MSSSFLFRALFAQFLLFSLTGCSFLKTVSSEQCQTDNDCAHFGAYTCSSDKVCVAISASGGNGGGAGDGGSSGSTGIAGTTSAPECTENSDCIDAHSGAPYVCQSGACVALTDEGQCPFVIAGPDNDPNAYLTQAGEPIIIGAYVPIGVSAPESHPYTLTYRFALEEFMTGTLGGVGAGANSPHRPIVMVLCQSDHPDLKTSVNHLVNTLNVPGILASLDAPDLAAAFDAVTQTKRSVFLLGPEQADNALVGVQDNGLMWHVLGPTSDLLPAYGPLVSVAETYVRNYLYSGSTSQKLRLAVVNSDESWSRDMATGFSDAVQLNGKLLSDATNASNYQRFEMSVTGPKGAAGADASGFINALDSTTPGSKFDIIVSLGGTEFFDQVLKPVQDARMTLNKGPFYVLSPANAFDGHLSDPTYFKGDGYVSQILKWSAGVNYASETDDTIYKRYLSAIQARFPNVTGLESRENFYDAAYYMFYSLAAAAGNGGAFDGTDLVAGMKRLVQVGRTTEGQYTVGPGKSGEMFANVLSALGQGFSIELDGAMGPPDFNLQTGARNSVGSVWCENLDTTSSTTPRAFVTFDELRLSSDSSMLTGTDFCFPSFFPPPQ